MLMIQDSIKLNFGLLAVSIIMVDTKSLILHPPHSAAPPA